MFGRFAHCQKSLGAQLEVLVSILEHACNQWLDLCRAIAEAPSGRKAKSMFGKTLHMLLLMLLLLLLLPAADATCCLLCGQLLLQLLPLLTLLSR